MKYFLHDTAAFEDEKITELYMTHGYEGVGLFFTILEKLAKQEKPIKTTVLKAQLHVGKRLEKCWKFMEEIGIISSTNGETFNEKLLNFSETFKENREKNRKKVSQWRDKQTIVNNVTSYEPVCNTPKGKVKEGKVNKSIYKRDFTPPSLEEFIQHFLENKFSKELAIRAYNGYKVGEWRDSKGNQIMNWKQKCYHVWFREENRTVNGLDNRPISKPLGGGEPQNFYYE